MENTPLNPIVYMGFKACQHQKSSEPMWNDFFMIKMANDIQGWFGPKLSWHLSYGWEKSPEKTSTRKTDWGSNLGLLGERQRCCPLIIAVVPKDGDTNKNVILYYTSMAYYAFYLEATEKTTLTDIFNVASSTEIRYIILFNNGYVLHLHQKRSPSTDGHEYVLNDKWLSYNQGQMWPNFPNIYLTVEEKFQKISTKNFPRLEIDLRPIGLKVLPPNHRSSLLEKEFGSKIQLLWRHVGLYNHLKQFINQNLKHTDFLLPLWVS